MSENFTAEGRKKGWLAFMEGVKKKRIIKEAWLKIALMSPKELESYEPENGLERMLITAITKAGTKEGALAITVLKEFKEAIGERIGSNWKETKTRDEGKPDIIMDLDLAKRTPEHMN